MAKILIVEDEGIIAENTGMFLKNMGHDVIGIIDNGEDAIDANKENNPDLILVDITLQGELNGIDTVKIINERSDVPVIYMTAHPHNTHVKELAKTTYCEYLQKPFAINKLKNAIENALRKM